MQINDRQIITRTDFIALLKTWYDKNKRTLPWRETNDPYKIWLSEVILQQTRVAQGLPYYLKFIQAYPTIAQLAHAAEEKILRLWQGLGYYSRARNLHTCAKMIVTQHGGIFPPTYQALLQLKGIGPYTAAAIASIAFKEPVAVVDGNVYRVLARIFGIEQDIATRKGVLFFQKFSQELLPKTQVGCYNQAIMDFGAIVCTPSKPVCPTCIFQNYCVACRTNKQKLLPIKSKKIAKKHRYFYYCILQHHQYLYMKKRTGSDIWKGLFDFHLIETKKKMSIDELNDSILAFAKVHQISVHAINNVYQHTLTHQQLHSYFLYIEGTTPWIKLAKPLLKKMMLQAYTVKEIENLPKPILIDQFLKKNNFLCNFKKK